MTNPLDFGPGRFERRAGLRNLRRGEGANPLNPHRKHFLDNAKPNPGHRE
jgi:hypothetical protein